MVTTTHTMMTTSHENDSQVTQEPLYFFEILSVEYYAVRNGGEIVWRFRLPEGAQQTKKWHLFFIRYENVIASEADVEFQHRRYVAVDVSDPDFNVVTLTPLNFTHAGRWHYRDSETTSDPMNTRAHVRYLTVYGNASQTSCTQPRTTREGRRISYVCAIEFSEPASDVEHVNASFSSELVRPQLSLYDDSSGDVVHNDTMYSVEREGNATTAAETVWLARLEYRKRAEPTDDGRVLTCGLSFPDSLWPAPSDDELCNISFTVFYRVRTLTFFSDENYTSEVNATAAEEFTVGDRIYVQSDGHPARPDLTQWRCNQDTSMPVNSVGAYLNIHADQVRLDDMPTNCTVLGRNRLNTAGPATAELLYYVRVPAPTTTPVPTFPQPRFTLSFEALATTGSSSVLQIALPAAGVALVVVVAAAALYVWRRRGAKRVRDEQSEEERLAKLPRDLQIIRVMQQYCQTHGYTS